MQTFTALPAELDLDTEVIVTFTDGTTRCGIAGIFVWTTVVAYIEVE